MLFSQRKRIEGVIESWCRGNEIPINTFNVITGLDVLGYLSSNLATAPANPFGTCGPDYPEGITGAIGTIFSN